MRAGANVAGWQEYSPEGYSISPPRSVTLIVAFSHWAQENHLQKELLAASGGGLQHRVKRLEDAGADVKDSWQVRLVSMF